MHLKSLELHGFKSFSQKTVLEFLPPQSGRYSVTAVVGPNGSGKSNVADAIRWVMGEQSLKSLRGKKSSDIIFSGSEHKGQMGMASVTMVLDNQDGRAPLDYEELVITRRLYRSGESEYVINNNSVRLLDLQLLLARAQFGQGAYSVIGQGMIDRLLLQTPVERKDFFDEAVGIKEFQIKRHQAVLKLARTRENISQAELLLNEVSPRLRSLSRQVRKLEQRNAVALELREAQEQYYGSLEKYNREQLATCQTELAKIGDGFSIVQEQLIAVQTELANLAREESAQTVFEKWQKEYEDLSQQKNNRETERAILLGRMQTEYAKSGQQNLAWLESRLTTLRAENARLRAELEAAEENARILAKGVLEKKQQVNQLLQERTESRARVGQLEQRLLSEKGEQSYWRYSGLEAVQAVLEERHRLGQVYGTVAQLAEVKEEHCLALDVAAGAYLSSVVVDNDRTAQTCIEYLRQNQMGVATFLPLNKIRPRLVAQDIEKLKLFPGVVGLAVDLAKFDRRFLDIFSYVLGNTLVVRDLNVAREIGIGRVRMVTLAGDVLETSGSMKGGYRDTEKKRRLSFAHGDSPYRLQSGVAKDQEDLEEARRRADEGEIAYERAQEELRELLSRTQIVTNQVSILGVQKQNSERELSGLEQEMSFSNLAPEQFDAQKTILAEKKKQLDAEIEQLEKNLRTAAGRLEEFNDAQEQKKKRIFSLQENMQSLQGELNKIVEERNLKQMEAVRVETKLENLAHEAYQETGTSLELIREKGVEILPEAEIGATQEKVQKLKYQLSLIGGIDEEVVKEYEETKSKHDILTDQLTDLKAALGDLEQLTEELDEVMRKKRKRGFAQIRKEFARYFGLLFEGGKADLVELYGEKADLVLAEEDE
ncbi:MAG TPA: AAA family ATPase, partial [Patescibacteria group bacterium]|nr:AAA family ATPase [Patescibacteria group bacterium]